MKHNSKYHVLTAAHAVAPWKFPKLYPHEWLRFVNQDHTIFTAETRHEDGTMMSQLDLLPSAFFHPTRDLAVLHFENEKEALEVLEFSDIDCRLELTEENQIDMDLNEDIIFHGYDVEATPFTQDYRTDKKRFLRAARGKPILRTKFQIFCPTLPVLTDGMCGGPVCKSVTSTDGSLKIVCGLLEGIVPSNFSQERLRNAAVFVESGQIREFLADIEEGRIEPMESGSVQSIVGKNQGDTADDLRRVLDGE